VLLAAVLAGIGGRARAQGGPPPDLCALEFVPTSPNASAMLRRYTWRGTYYERSPLWGPLHEPGLGYPEVGALLDLDNETILVKNLDAAGVMSLTAVSPGGVATELFRDPFRPWPYSNWSLPVFDQSGDFVVTDWGTWPHRLVRIDRRGAIVATIAQGSFGSPDLLSVDLDTGDYLLLCHFSQPNGYRVTPSGTVTTLPGLESPMATSWESLESEYRSGTFIGRCHVWGGPWGWGRIQLAPSFQQNLIFISSTLGGVALHQSRRVLGIGPYGVGDVPATGPLGSGTTWPVSPPLALGFQGLHNAPVILGSRKLAGRGPATPGSEYELRLSFPSEGGNAYLMGASLSLRPGITLADGSYIPLRPDALLAWSLNDPGTFRGFSGTLDALGRATAGWRIPAVPALRGVRVFFAALSYDPSGIRTISNPIGVTVR
jgi:hypothetical protein